MTTERKRWWRQVAALTVGGSVVAGGLFGIVRATAESQKPPAAENAAWSRSSAPAAAPAVAEIERSGAPGGVVQASGMLPSIPPVVPITPLIPAPSAPFPAGLEPPAAGPRAPETTAVGSDGTVLPTVPSLPTVDLPKLPSAPTAATPVVPPVPAPPAALPMTPSAPAVLPLPTVPPAPGATPEPPKPPVPPAAPMMPTMPGVPPALVPQPPVTSLPVPPAQLSDPMQPMLPVKPDSGLNPKMPGNTLNPASPVAPAVPIAFPPANPGGREVPGTAVDRAKPAQPVFDATDKFVFPLPARSQTPRPTPLEEAAMLKLQHTAALAIIGGAMLTAEHARSAPLPITPALPTAPAKADVDTDKLKTDLLEANRKIAALEKQVAKLTELLTGKKDDLGLTVPSDPGAVAEVKELKNQIAKLDGELKALKTQTSLKPAITPESKPKGVVKVVNEYPVEISMVINDKSHRIAPNTKIEVEVPAGDFSYQLLQSGAAATRSVIKDKETVTLRIK